MKNMTLRELLSHFTNETIWVDMCTPLRRVTGEVREIKRDTPDNILDLEVSAWRYTNRLEIDM